MLMRQVEMQVGSKNAAFYMGRCIRVATKPADSAYVHELGIAAEALEARYREKQARFFGFRV